MKIKIRKEAEKPENSTNVTCGSSSSSFDNKEENEENSRRRKKVELKEAEAIKIEIRKEAEKLQNHMCVSSSSSSSEYCIYDNRERFAYLAEEGRRTVGQWETTTASLAFSWTPPSSSSTSVPAVAERTPFSGAGGRSLHPEHVRNFNGTLCAESQCRTADIMLSKDESRSQARLFRGRGWIRTETSRSKHEIRGKSRNLASLILKRSRCMMLFVV